MYNEIDIQLSLSRGNCKLARVEKAERREESSDFSSCPGIATIGLKAGVGQGLSNYFIF